MPRILPPGRALRPHLPAQPFPAWYKEGLSLLLLRSRVSAHALDALRAAPSGGAGDADDVGGGPPPSGAFLAVKRAMAEADSAAQLSQLLEQEPAGQVCVPAGGSVADLRAAVADKVSDRRG